MKIKDIKNFLDQLDEKEEILGVEFEDGMDYICDSCDCYICGDDPGHCEYI